MGLGTETESFGVVESLDVVVVFVVDGGFVDDNDVVVVVVVVVGLADPGSESSTTTICLYTGSARSLRISALEWARSSASLPFGYMIGSRPPISKALLWTTSKVSTSDSVMGRKWSGMFT